MSAPGDQFLRAESASTQGTRKRKAPPEEEPADDDGAAPVTTTPRPGDPPLSDAELEAAAQRVAVELTRGGTPTEKMQWLEGLGPPCGGRRTRAGIVRRSTASTTLTRVRARLQRPWALWKRTLFYPCRSLELGASSTSIRLPRR